MLSFCLRELYVRCFVRVYIRNVRVCKCLRNLLDDFSLILIHVILVYFKSKLLCDTLCVIYCACMWHVCRCWYVNAFRHHEREQCVLWNTCQRDIALCAKEKSCRLGTSVVTVLRADIKRWLKLYLLYLSIAITRYFPSCYVFTIIGGCKNEISAEIMWEWV